MNKRILLAILLTICLLTLGACNGGKDAEATMTGQYVIVDIAEDPDGMTFAELEAMYREMDQNIGDHSYFEFMDDGQFRLVLFGEEEAKGTYARDGGILTLTVGEELPSAAGETAANGGTPTAAGEATADGGITIPGGITQTATVSGKRITWTYENGAKLVFEKTEQTAGAEQPPETARDSEAA
jgi:hypothetical protein